jgi:hypothetical protein
MKFFTKMPLDVKISVLFLLVVYVAILVTYPALAIGLGVCLGGVVATTKVLHYWMS